MPVNSEDQETGLRLIAKSEAECASRILTLAVLLLAACLFLPVPDFLVRRPFAPERSFNGCRRVLFIGNSLTFFYEIPENTERLAKLLSPNRPLCVSALAEPGVTLEWHWASKDVQDALLQPWDYVILQEQSIRSYEEPDQMEKYLGLFVEKIRLSGGEPLLYQIFSKAWSEERHVSLRTRMEQIARSLRVRLVPVDLVWDQLIEELPASPILSEDLHHPAPFGAYSAALSFASCLTGVRPVDALPFTIYEPPRFIIELVWPFRTNFSVSQVQAVAALRAVVGNPCRTPARW